MESPGRTSKSNVEVSVVDAEVAAGAVDVGVASVVILGGVSPRLCEATEVEVTS